MRAQERVCLENIDPRVNPESELNARRITALSHSSRHTVQNIISQFKGINISTINESPNIAGLPHSSMSIPNDSGSVSKQYSMFILVRKTALILRNLPTDMA